MSTLDWLLLACVAVGMTADAESAIVANIPAVTVVMTEYEGI